MKQKLMCYLIIAIGAFFLILGWGEQVVNEAGAYVIGGL